MGGWVHLVRQRWRCCPIAWGREGDSVGVLVIRDSWQLSNWHADPSHSPPAAFLLPPPHPVCSAGTGAAWDAQSVAALMQLARSLPNLSVQLERSEPPGMHSAAAPGGPPS